MSTSHLVIAVVGWHRRDCRSWLCGRQHTKLSNYPYVNFFVS